MLKFSLFSNYRGKNLPEVWESCLIRLKRLEVKRRGSTNLNKNYQKKLLCILSIQAFSQIWNQTLATQKKHYQLEYLKQILKRRRPIMKLKITGSYSDVFLHHHFRTLDFFQSMLIGHHRINKESILHQCLRSLIIWLPSLFCKVRAQKWLQELKEFQN